MPRLFTALEIPDPLASRLTLVRGGLAGARWVEPENFHITLRFIGDVDNATAHEIDNELAKIRHRKFAVAVNRLDVFGGARPRALVALAQQTASLLDLQAEHERTVRRIGMAPETRKFTPHVTLARLRGASAADVAAYLAMWGLFPEAIFVAERVVLMSSRPSTGGAPYVEESVYALS